MLYVAIFLIGLIVGVSTCMIILLRIRKRYSQNLRLLQDVHKEEWRDMIGKVHHAQAVPPGTRIVGIANLMYVALTRIIERLQRQQSAQDYNNLSVILEIQEIILVELQMLKKSIGDWLEEVRKSIKPYEDKQ